MTKPIHAMPLCAPALLLAAQMFTAGFEARAADFTVNSATTVTNGAAGRTLNTGDNLTVTEDGSITTSTDGTDGINSESGASNNTIINDGSITTNNQLSRGIEVRNNNEITNNGSITTRGDNSNGIDADDRNTITNTGRITTQTSNGIRISDNNTITNSGDITAANPRFGAIFLEGTDPSSNTLSNTGRIITTTGRGISGNPFSFLTTLTNRVGTKANSGRIQGSTDGINVGFIGSLTNGPGAVIEGTGGDGVKLTRTPGPTTGTGKASVTNSGTIKGGAYGLDYGKNTISTLTNNTGGLIQGGTQAAVAAAAIDRLDNEGRIVSTDHDGIRTTGATDRLTNSGEISGGRHGISAASVDRLTNTNTGVIKGGTKDGTNGDGINTTGANTRLENSGEISGGRHGIRAASVDELTNKDRGEIKGTSGDGINSTGAITDLENSGEISGGRDGIRAGSVDRLTNKDRGEIKGTSGDGINSTGAITRLENSGEITGGRHGISAASVDLTNSGDITGGTSATGAGDKAGVNLGAGDSAIANTGRITSARGRGISGLATSNITTLSNTVNPGVVGSGLIRGSSDGINVGFIGSLTNGPGAVIEGTTGDGVKLTRIPSLSTGTGKASVTNSGTIKGAAYGLDYAQNTISTLTNNDGGLIEGGSEAAVAAAAIDRLVNEAGGRIVSTDHDGIRATGAIGELNNRGEITGGQDGIEAGSIGTLRNDNLIQAGTGAGVSSNGDITRLDNNAGSRILSTSGDGVRATGAIGELNNSGEISGGRDGIEAGSIGTLRNDNLIQAGTGAGVSSNGDITRLDNNAGSRILSTSGDGIRSAGAIGTLNNSGEISGGRHGISAASVGLLNTGVIRGGTSATVTGDKAAVHLTGAGSRITNRGEITAASGDGIGGGPAASITTLTNEVGTAPGSGVIRGAANGIRAGLIGSLTNNAGAIIEGQNGAGITLSGASGNGSVTNRGTIKGTTFGMNYGNLTLTLLRNSGTGRIEGGSEAAVSAAAITRLDNEAGGRIVSTDHDGIRTTGAIGELNNSGEISGGRHGISAASVGLTNSGDITGGTSATGAGDKAGVNLGAGDSAIANTGRITSARGRGISGLATSNITTLSNTVNPGVANSGLIRGSSDGIAVGRIGSLTNNAGALIEGQDGAGITLSGMSGNGSVTNRGTIKGTTFGMNYGDITLSLTNTGTGRIEGGSEAAVSAAAITRLDNEAGGQISSTSGDGINSTGAIGELNNRGEITGGRDGIEAGSIGTLRNDNLIQAGTGAGVSSNSDITRLDNNAGGRIRSTNGDGIRSTGAIGELNNRGEISGGRDGIRAGSIGTLSNRKTIRGGAGGAGLNVSGEVTTLTNHRDAEITGGGDGVRAGSLNALTNDGRIISSTGGGVTLTGRSDRAATVVNNGTIQGATHGMDYGRNTIASLTNTSSESIRGGTGDALRARALRRLNNSGAIVSTSAGGVTLTGRDASGAEYTNSGRIEGRTHGLDYGDNALARLDNTASGILRSGEGAAVKGRGGLKRLTNRGRIEGKTGIELRREATAGGSDGATIENYGLLRGTGGTALGLFGPGRDTLRLFEGSRLEGLVRWDGSGDTFFYAPREPGIFSFRDTDGGPNVAPTRFTIEAPAQQTILRSTVRSAQAGEGRTTVAFVDSSLYALADNTLSRWTGSVAEALAQQTRSEGPGGEGREFWLRPFAGYQRFGREGLRPSARHEYLGGVAGFSLPRGLARIGVFGGGATAEVEVSGVARDQESNSFFAGAYAHGPVRGLHVHGALLVGQSRFESSWGQFNSLASGGRERVGVDYDSLFLSPQLGLLAGGFDLLGLKWRPAVQLRYLARFTDEHAYAPAGGGPALLSIKAHDVHMGLLRAEVRAPGRLWKGEHGRLHGEMRLGAEGGLVFAGREIPVRLGGGDTAFKAGSGHSATGFIGAGLRYSLPRLKLTLSADVEGSYGSDSATSVWGQVGFEWEF